MRLSRDSCREVVIQGFTVGKIVLAEKSHPVGGKSTRKTADIKHNVAESAKIKHKLAVCPQ